jgi:hypothetical protein
MDHGLYTVMAQSLLQFSRNEEWLDSVHAHSMGAVSSSRPQSVLLYLTHRFKDPCSSSESGDYQVELTLIGLKQLLGD